MQTFVGSFHQTRPKPLLLNTIVAAGRLMSMPQAIATVAKNVWPQNVCSTGAVLSNTVPSVNARSARVVTQAAGSREMQPGHDGGDGSEEAFEDHHGGCEEGCGARVVIAAEGEEGLEGVVDVRRGKGAAG